MVCCLRRFSFLVKQYIERKEMDKNPRKEEKVVKMSVEGFPSHLMEAINKSIKIKVGQAATKFQLTESEIEELESAVRCKVIEAYAKHNGQESGFLTYAQFVIANYLTNWKKHEYLRRKHIVPMTEEREQIVANLESDDEAKARNAEKVQAVMYAISQLSNLEKRVCQLHMRYHSLEKVRKVIGQPCNRFYKITWPLTRKHFERFYNEAIG